VRSDDWTFDIISAAARPLPEASPIAALYVQVALPALAVYCCGQVDLESCQPVRMNEYA